MVNAVENILVTPKIPPPKKQHIKRDYGMKPNSFKTIKNVIEKSMIVREMIGKEEEEKVNVRFLLPEH